MRTERIGVCIAALGLAGAFVVLCGRGPVEAVGGRRQVAEPQAPVAVMRPVPVRSSAMTVDRAAKPSVAPAVGRTAVHAGSFEARFARLVDRMERGRELAPDGPDELDSEVDRAALDELQRAFEDELDALVVVFPDAAPRAFSIVAAVPGDAQGGDADTVFAVGSIVVDVGLQLLVRHGEQAAALDAAVGQMVGSMPTSVRLAEFVRAALDGHGHLGRRQEPLLVGMVRDEDLDPAIRAAARALLLDLWRGVDDDELVSDLLAWFGGGDSAMFESALERLLTVEGYRDLVLTELVRRADPRLARRAGDVLVRTLPFDDAVRELARLEASLDTWSLATPYLTLGDLAPQPLLEHYEEVLARGVQPRHRRALVVGLTGSRDRSIARHAVRTVLREESDPGVRAVAMLAAGRLVDGAEFERFTGSMLADRRFAQEADHLAFIVLGLQQLAARCDPNIVDRVSARLLAAPLYESSRRQVAELREQFVPR